MPVQYHYIQADLTTPAFFEANQRGEITPQQRRWLELSILSIIGCFSYLGAIFAVPFLCFIISMLLFVANIPGLVVGLFAGSVALGTLIFTVVRGVEFQKEQNKVKRDLNSARLAQAEGQLTYRNGNYEFQAGQLLLKLPGERGGMAPGIRYQVYYLVESEVALSAQLASYQEALDQGSDQARQGLTEILSHALGYSLQSLEANRRGELAADQGKALLPEIWRGGLIALFSGAIAGFILYSLFTSPSRGDVGWWLGLLFSVGIGGYFLYQGISRLLRAWMDLSRRRVVSVEGVGKRVFIRTSSPSGHSSSSSSVSYSYLVGRKRFRIPPKFISAVIDGLLYRAYFTPRSETLIAIEPRESPLKLS